jgi:hypothetical protein
MDDANFDSEEVIMQNLDSLKALHTSLIDAEKGYEEAVKDADSADMEAIFEKMRSWHEQSHDEVHAILLSKGERPDESGSFMSRAVQFTEL